MAKWIKRFFVHDLAYLWCECKSDDKCLIAVLSVGVWGFKLWLVSYHFCSSWVPFIGRPHFTTLNEELFFTSKVKKEKSKVKIKRLKFRLRRESMKTQLRHYLTLRLWKAAQFKFCSCRRQFRLWASILHGFTWYFILFLKIWSMTSKASGASIS